MCVNKELYTLFSEWFSLWIHRVNLFFNDREIVHFYYYTSLHTWPLNWNICSEWIQWVWRHTLNKLLIHLCKMFIIWHFIWSKHWCYGHILYVVYLAFWYVLVFLTIILTMYLMPPYCHLTASFNNKLKDDQQKTCIHIVAALQFRIH